MSDWLDELGLGPEPPPKEELISLSDEQTAALDAILSGEHPVVMIVGKAGTGKSRLIHRLKQHRPVVVVAPTGRAAINVGGCTWDRYWCVKRETGQVFNEKALARQMENSPSLVVVDEAWMLSAVMINAMEQLAEKFDKQLVLVGDPRQARPVLGQWGTTTPLFQQAKVFRLNKVFRQEEGPYLDALNLIGQGEITDEARSLFLARQVSQPPDDDRYVRLSATKKTVLAYNQRRLNEMPNQQDPLVTLTAVHDDLRSDYAQQNYPVSADQVGKRLEDSPFASNLQIRKGARVIITLNASVQEPDEQPEWVNGDAGEIVELVEKVDVMEGEDGEAVTIAEPYVPKPYNPWANEKPSEPKYIQILLDRTGDTVLLGRAIRQVEDGRGEPIYSVAGFPVMLGWAMTIHKAQGMTVERAFLDIQTILHHRDRDDPRNLKLPPEKRSSRHGLLYVGLSRTTTLEGLLISGWSDDAVRCDEEVLPFIREDTV